MGLLAYKQIAPHRQLHRDKLEGLYFNNIGEVPIPQPAALATVFQSEFGESGDVVSFAAPNDALLIGLSL